jgi:hypothetical protein
MHGKWICLVLDKPGVEEHWDIKIELNDSEAAAYLSAFEVILPPSGTKARRLMDALGQGASIERVKEQYLAGTPVRLTKTYFLRLPNGLIEEIGDDAPEFISFVMGRAYLKNPQNYEVFRRDHLATDS